MKEEVLSLATFTLGALCFFTFLVMVKPMSFGVEESSSSFSYEATSNQCRVASSRRSQHCSAWRIAHDNGNGFQPN
jgi:hypothetical protein